MRGNAEEGFAGEAELDFAVDFDFDDVGFQVCPPITKTNEQPTAISFSVTC
jgi:hypothetical protein